MARTRRSHSSGQRALEGAGLATLLCVAIACFLLSATVRYVVGRYFTLFMPSVAAALEEAPTFDLGRSSPTNVALVIVLALLVLVAWGRAARVVRSQLVAGKSLEQLLALSPDAFEEWAAARFRELGYRVRLTGKTGDHGVDLVAESQAERAVVQCKRYRGSIGEPVLRELFGAMHAHAANRAYLVTTGTLTAPATRWIRDKPIEVWDRDRLGRMATGVADKASSHGDRVHTAAWPISGATPEIQADITAGSGPSGVPSANASCPKCASLLVQRLNRRTGETFLGCAGYPDCRHTQPLTMKSAM